jgi:hypothetical protein
MLDIANEGLEELGKHVDSLIVILNEKLEEIYEDDSMLEWLGHADDVLNNAVAGIAEIINVPGHINVDFNDVKTIMAEQGKAMMGTAVASGLDRARIAAEQAVASPLLDGIDLSGARGVLVNVTASRSLKGKEIKQVMETVRAFAAPDASIAQGIAYDDAMGDEVRVTVVATGLGRARRPQLVSTPVARTGTYDARRRFQRRMRCPAPTRPSSRFAPQRCGGASMHRRRCGRWSAMAPRLTISRHSCVVRRIKGGFEPAGNWRAGHTLACPLVERGWIEYRDAGYQRRPYFKEPPAFDHIIPAEAGIQHVQLHLPLSKGPL